MRERQKIRDKLFIDLCYDNKEIPFINFLQYNQWLYENVDLTKNEIDYINNYYYDYKVDPTNFERRFQRVLSRAIPTFKQLKSIELQDDIFKITNNSYVRKITTDTLNNLSSNGTNTNTTTNTNDGNIKNTGKAIGSNKTTNNSQTANKTLPMSSDNSGFDSLFDWEGASGVSEVNETDNNNTSNTTENTTIDTSKNTINGNATNTLTNITNNNFNSEEKYEQTNGQVVGIVKNIWTYLVAPKAIDYLVGELEKCFILIY